MSQQDQMREFPNEHTSPLALVITLSQEPFVTNLLLKFLDHIAHLQYPFL